MTFSGWMLLLAAPIAGSWLGVLVRRWPNGEPVAMARSCCEHCQHVLAPRDLVPLLSYAWLRGRCRYCGGKIDPFHPAIELAAASIALTVVLAEGGGAKSWIDAGVGWALLCAAWIDFDTFRLPDLITLPLILAGLAVTWAFQFPALYDHAAAALVGYLAFRLLDFAYLILRHRQGLGEGDAKLLAGAGAWLGLQALPYVILGAGVMGIAMVLGRREGPRGQRKIAFGPALALAFFLMLVFGQYIPMTY